MNELSISDNFTVDDIHRVREYHYEITKKASGAHITRTRRWRFWQKLASCQRTRDSLFWGRRHERAPAQQSRPKASRNGLKERSK